MNEQTQKQPQWYLLTGLIFGLILGLVFSVLILPVENADALPAELDQAGKDDYRAMIALAYSANQDLESALTRLELLAEPNTVDLLIAQAQNTFAENGDETIARALAGLAARLSQYLPE